jgi:ESCRT-II complex subunit VPS36
MVVVVVGACAWVGAKGADCHAYTTSSSCDTHQTTTRILAPLSRPPPPTRHTSQAGSSSAFHTGLATELGQFLVKPLADQNGMLLLHDVYCMYNRARGGIQLISPTDLINACSQFTNLGIPMVLHEFASGVIVIRDAALNDDAVVAKVAAFVSEHGGTSPSQLARGEGVSLTLAREQLLTAEGMGALCRDDTIDCMRFYPNRFLTEGSTSSELN